MKNTSLTNTIKWLALVFAARGDGAALVEIHKAELEHERERRVEYAERMAPVSAVIQGALEEALVHLLRALGGPVPMPSPDCRHVQLLRTVHAELGPEASEAILARVLAGVTRATGQEVIRLFGPAVVRTNGPPPSVPPPPVSASN